MMFKIIRIIALLCFIFLNMLFFSLNSPRIHKYLLYNTLYILKYLSFILSHFNNCNTLISSARFLPQLKKIMWRNSHTHIHPPTHMYIHIPILILIYIYMRRYIFMYMYICTHTCVYTLRRKRYFFSFYYIFLEPSYKILEMWIFYG